MELSQRRNALIEDMNLSQYPKEVADSILSAIMGTPRPMSSVDRLYCNFEDAQQTIIDVTKLLKRNSKKDALKELRDYMTRHNLAR